MTDHVIENDDLEPEDDENEGVPPYGEDLDEDESDETEEDYDDADHDEESDDDDSDDEDNEDELPTLGDIFGYENDEDNEEAALDHVLKMQERADD